MSEWFRVANVEDIPSPALLLYPDRIRENIRRMIRIAGGPARLRPHVKTHKLPELVRMQMEEGITKFKCATIAEAEMAASAGATDVLLAFPLVGPNIRRWGQLAQQFPDAHFCCVADDAPAIGELARVFAAAGRTAEVLLDVDCGQHRTGVEPGTKALELYRLLASTPGVMAGGLHVYDGHIHESDLGKRKALCAAAFAPVNAFCDQLKAAGLRVTRIVAGGTPTFALHAADERLECSPGTCVLWDFGYSTKFADLDFLHAALVLTRVISKPGVSRLCLDLGHKAIAAENPPPRVQFLNLPDAAAVAHNEEHLVIESAAAAALSPGDHLFGVPRHICPTVALYSDAAVLRDGRVVDRWRITARERRLNI